MNTGDGSSYPGRYESLERDAVIPTPLRHNLTRTRAPKGSVGNAPSGVRLTFHVTIEKLIAAQAKVEQEPCHQSDYPRTNRLRFNSEHTMTSEPVAELSTVSGACPVAVMK
jgi:hypothetical protein